MYAALKKFAGAALLCAPVLAGCTQTPETVFNWDVNDHLASRPRSDYARAAYVRADTSAQVTSRNLPKAYSYRGRDYAVPTPKPRPGDRPVSTPTYAYQPPVADSGDAPSFVWPVTGPVISDFGKSTNGERNDGINISTAMDTPIHAAAGGTVTYSGNELKDYGNLVLIRHADGYVTAYAHADRLLVNRGDTVARGQVIGYAGTTGDVRTPQLHFEIRHGTKPVDPAPLLTSRES
jgi:murein DD-endopeptidase MepM/ murein hydrolase activator NlpD